jgi:hypothetical protein
MHYSVGNLACGKPRAPHPDFSQSAATTLRKGGEGKVWKFLELSTGVFGKGGLPAGNNTQNSSLDKKKGQLFAINAEFMYANS